MVRVQWCLRLDLPRSSHSEGLLKLDCFPANMEILHPTPLVCWIVKFRLVSPLLTLLLVDAGTKRRSWIEVLDS